MCEFWKGLIKNKPGDISTDPNTGDIQGVPFEDKLRALKLMLPWYISKHMWITGFYVAQ